MRLLPTHTALQAGLSHHTLTSLENGITRLYLTAHMDVPRLCEGIELSFFAEMLERGSKRYSKDRYDQTIESLGAQVSFDTDGATLTMRIAVLTVHLDKILGLIQDTLAHPLFLQTEIAKARTEYVQALHEERDNSRALAYGLFARALYTSREANYVPPLTTRRKILASINRARLTAIHKTFLQTAWIVSSAGEEQAHQSIARTFSAIHLPSEKKLASTPTAESSAPASPATLTEEVKGKQNIELFIGNRLPITLSHKDFLAFSFGLDVLGKRGGFSGRLMKTVRDAEGLTYMIYAWVRGATATTCGHFNISTFFTPKDTPRGLASTQREIKKIVEKGITTEELVRFKELLRNQFRLAHESTSSVLSLYHRAFVAGRTLDDIVDYPKHLEALTRTEVNQALRTYLLPTQLVIAGAGPTEILSAKG